MASILQFWECRMVLSVFDGMLSKRRWQNKSLYKMFVILLSSVLLPKQMNRGSPIAFEWSANLYLQQVLEFLLRFNKGTMYYMFSDLSTVLKSHSVFYLFLIVCRKWPAFLSDDSGNARILRRWLIWNVYVLKLVVTGVFGDFFCSATTSQDSFRGVQLYTYIYKFTAFNKIKLIY